MIIIARRRVLLCIVHFINRRNTSDHFIINIHYHFFLNIILSAISTAIGTSTLTIVANILTPFYFLVFNKIPSKILTNVTIKVSLGGNGSLQIIIITSFRYFKFLFFKRFTFCNDCKNNIDYDGC